MTSTTNHPQAFTAATYPNTAHARLACLLELVADGVLLSVVATNERQPRYDVSWSDVAGIASLTLVGDACDAFIQGARAVQGAVAEGRTR